MSKEQKFLLMGILADKKRELEEVTIALNAKTNSIQIFIMPEIDIVYRRYEEAKVLLDECVVLKKRYLELTAAIKEREESI